MDEPLPLPARGDVWGWMKERDQWRLWSYDSAPSKKPLDENTTGRGWSDPGCWFSFEEAYELAESDPRFDGIGFVISKADPYYYLDLDGCLREPFAEKPKDWVPDISQFEGQPIQFSTSGGGLSIFGSGSIPSWWTDVSFENRDHEGVEAYDEKFVIVTGRPVSISGDEPAELDPEPWLIDALRNVTGETASLQPSDDHEQREYDGEEWLDADDVRDALDYVDPDVDYGTWRNIGFAVHSFDSGSTGRSLFEGWSRGGSKWDDRAEYYVDAIWTGASPGGGVGLGSLIYHARDAGWSMPSPQRSQPAADGGAATATAQEGIESSEDDSGPTWADVRALLDSKENGSTTRACGLAAKILSTKHHFAVIRETSGFYFFNPRTGYYVRKGMTFLDELVEAQLPNRMNPSRLRTIRQKVRSRNYVSTETDDPGEEVFEPPERKVNLKNGVLDLERGEEDPYNALEEHSPDYYFTSRLDVKYDPDAESEFLIDAIATAIPDPGERKKFLEFVGYTLEMWTANREKAMFFVGYSGAGKSTIQEMVDSMFGGPPSKIALAPHQIADSRFDSGRLAEASLNALNDINGGKITDSGTLKRVISGEVTKMENKNETPQFGRPTAKHLWTCNWVPRIVGEDDAIWRRFLIIEFLNRIPDEEASKEYKERLKTDQNVRSALLNLALKGRQRLDEQGGFTNDRTRTETRLLWDKWRDSNKLFLHEHFELTGSEDDNVEKKTYMQAYGEWAAKEGVEQQSQQSVSTSFGYVPEIGGTDGGSDFYDGLKWRDSDDMETPTQNERLRKIRKYVAAFERPDDPAPIDAVVNHAAENGIEPDKSRSDIKNLLETGQLHEPEQNKIRLTGKSDFF